MRARLRRRNREPVGAEHIVRVEVRFATLGGKCVLMVHCNRSKLPVCLKDDNTEHFFIRTGPASVELQISQVLRCQATV